MFLTESYTSQFDRLWCCGMKIKIVREIGQERNSPIPVVYELSDSAHTEVNCTGHNINTFRINADA